MSALQPYRDAPRCAAGLALATLALLGACGGDPEPVPALQRLALAPAEGAEARPVRIAFRAGGEALPRDAQDTTGVLEGEGVRFEGGGAHVLTLPLGGLDVGAVDGVALELSSAVDLGLSAALTRSDGRRIATPLVRKTERGPRRRIVLDLRAPRPAGEHASELVLSATRRSGDLDWTLFGVGLVARPLEVRVSPDERPVELAGDLRPAVGVTPALPLRARARLPEAGGFVTFGLASALAEGAKDATLVCRAGSAEVRTPLASSADWTTVTLPLDALEGTTVDVHFSVEGTPGGAAAWVAGAALGTRRDDAPSVLLVTSDTHRADHVGFASGIPAWTPAIDALAARGVAFERALASSNVTIPSHAALMTGIDPVTSGVDDNHTRLASRAETLAEAFKSAGYVTFASTSVRLLSDPWCGLGQGFDRHGAPLEGHEPGAVAIERLEGWLADADGLPLFAWLHVYDAHRPYEPPDDLRAPHYPAQKDAFDPALPDPDFPPVPGVKGLRDVEWARAGYRGEVGLVDRGIGPLLADSRFARGWIAVTADHGESLGAHGIFWNHVGLYPDTLHVPLVIAGPGIEGGERIGGSVPLTDLGATLLDLAGAGSSGFPGRSLLAAAAEPEPHFALASESQAASLTLGRWHLILILREVERTRDAPEQGVFERHAVELYDLDADPDCARDLSRVEADLAGRLRARLVQWLSEDGDSSLSIDVGGAAQAEDEGLLAQLGYTGGGAGAGARIDPDCACARCAEFR